MLKKMNPTSPGRRGQVNIKNRYTKKKPSKALTKPIKGAKGRSHGRISVRHQSRGAKKHYRIIDFKRDKEGVEGIVSSIEYDPNRNANIALITYLDGEKRYILAPKGLKLNDKVVSGDTVDPSLGNAMPLSSIPLGTPIHNIELQPGKGGQMARGAGTSAVITAKEGDYVNLKMPSGEIRKVLAVCFATIGEVGNEDYKNRKIGKAGRKRHMGIRPSVRGVAYSNPRDHSHGGSYTSSGVGKKHPVSPSGVPSKGYKTRKRKKTDIYKVKDRRKK